MFYLALILATAGLLPFEQNGKWGYRDQTGRILIPPQYEIAREFSPQGIAGVVDDQGWAYIDTTGKVRVRPIVVDNGPDYFREGLARFASEGKVGFFDRSGKVIIGPMYSYALAFSEGRAAVCDGCVEVEEGEHKVVKGGRWGFINRTGRLVIPVQFSDAGSFERGRARVRIGRTWKYVGYDGRVVSAR